MANAKRSHEQVPDGPFVSALRRVLRYIVGFLAAVCAIALFVIGTREATRADPPVPSDDFVHTVVGEAHTCATTTSGVVYCWGDNQSGQSGAGERVERDAMLAYPIRIDVPGFVTMLVAGQSHTCALNSDGDVYCWGLNSEGQSGNASGGPVVDEPRKVKLRHSVTALAAGQNHTCVVTDDGTMWCWGSNRDGQIKPEGSQEDDVKAAYPAPQAIELPEDAAGVSLASNESCGIVVTGDVFCWSDAVDYSGYSEAGDASDEREGSTGGSAAGREDSTEDSAGDSPAERETSGTGRGSSSSGGEGSEAGRQSPGPGRESSSSAAGGEDSGTSRDGSGSADGEEQRGETEAIHQVPLSPDYSKKAAAITNGPYGIDTPWHCAFFATREVSCWPSSSRGDFEMMRLDVKVKLPVANFAGANGYRINENGAVVRVTPESDAEGALSAGVVELPGKATSISSGYGADHWCAVLASGDTYCWGNNDRGQLGNGQASEETGAQTPPVRVGS